MKKLLLRIFFYAGAILVIVALFNAKYLQKKYYYQVDIYNFNKIMAEKNPSTKNAHYNITINPKNKKLRVAISGDNYSDLVPIAKLKDVEKLMIESNIDNCSIFYKLKELKTFYLNKSQVSNVNFLKGLPVEKIFLQDNYKLTDFAGLKNNKIKILTLSHLPRFKNTAALSDNLKDLIIINTAVEKLELKNPLLIEKLLLVNNQKLVDISQIKDMINLKSLMIIANNSLSKNNYKFLNKLKNLETLCLDNNTEIIPFNKLKKLKIIDFGNYSKNGCTIDFSSLKGRKLTLIRLHNITDKSLVSLSGVNCNALILLSPQVTDYNLLNNVNITKSISLDSRYYDKLPKNLKVKKIRSLKVSEEFEDINNFRTVFINKM